MRPLVAVAHGSSNPDAAATMNALASQVRRLAPVIDIRVAYVQHSSPSLSQALDDAGDGAVVVPLLLSTGYHLTVDIAGSARRVAGPLGPDQLLVTALASRLTNAGVPAGTPVVLAAAGSTDPLATDQVESQAKLLAGELDVEVLPAYAASGQPTVAEAVADLRRRTGGPVAIASYLLAPGHFHDSLANAGADWVTEPLGAHPAVAALIIDRYRAIPA
jgi:sirohydrochlorin ferrochelatase